MFGVRGMDPVRTDKNQIIKLFTFDFKMRKRAPKSLSVKLPYETATPDWIIVAVLIFVTYGNRYYHLGDQR